MKLKIQSFIILLSSVLFAQNNNISGFITDKETGEALIGLQIEMVIMLYRIFYQEVIV